MAASKGKYVDGYVLALPKKKLEAYRKVAQMAGKVWRKYGALSYTECVMEDPKPKWITLTFGKMLTLKPTETAVFSYITYRSRAHRDAVNAKVMKDPIMTNPTKEMMTLFDMKRMSHAGFDIIVDA